MRKKKADLDAQSIYWKLKIDNFKEEERAKRAKQAVDDGKYSSIEEAIPNIPDPNVMSCAKNIVINHSSVASAPLPVKIESIRFVIEQILQLDAERFCNQWSSTSFKNNNLYAHIQGIIKSAPKEILKECMMDSKMVFLKMVWPGKDFAYKVDPYDLFFGQDPLSQESIHNLIKYGKVSNIYNGKPAKYGKLVDEILVDIIENVIYDHLDLNTDEEIFGYLASWDADSKRKNKAKIYSVIESRGYGYLLDFYYLNLHPAAQKSSLKTYLLCRERAHLPHESYLDSYIKASIFADNYGKENKSRVNEIYASKAPLVKNGSLSKMDALILSRNEELTERYEKASADYNTIIESFKQIALEEEWKKKAPVTETECEIGIAI